MKRTVLAALVAMTTFSAYANEIDDAMKRVGPAYMCGPEYEYRASLSDLKSALLDAGVPESLAVYAVTGISEWIVKEHSANRKTMTAEDCNRVYGR